MGTTYVSNLDRFKNRRIGVQLKFIWIPKTCYISGKLLWLERAYKETALWTGPDEPMFEYRWYDKKEYIFAKIKGIV